jgi:hypothetical protein
MNTSTSGIRLTDAILAVALSAIAVLLGLEDIRATPSAAKDLAHSIDSHSWLIIPVFLASTIPVLWRRSGATVVTAIALVAMTAHLFAFGWVVRCGLGLPLAFVLAYSVGALEDRARGILGLALVFALEFVVLVKDSAAGLGIIGYTVAIAAVFYGAGVFVRSRASQGGAAPTHAGT